MSEDRRRVYRVIREIGRISPNERVWILIYLTSGQKPPISEATFERDALIRKYRAERYADIPLDRAARAIADDLKRYSTSAWRADQLRRAPADSRHRPLFNILKQGRPVGFEAIRKILKFGI